MEIFLRTKSKRTASDSNRIHMFLTEGIHVSQPLNLSNNILKTFRIWIQMPDVKLITRLQSGYNKNVTNTASLSPVGHLVYATASPKRFRAHRLAPREESSSERRCRQRRFDGPGKVNS